MIGSNRIVGRRGFTLIELLVVIAIIAVLVSLTAAAVLKFVGAGSARSTDSTLQMLKTLIERQWSSVAEKARNEAITATSQAILNAVVPDVGDGFLAVRQRVVYVKLRLRQSFPINFAEIFAPTANTLGTLPAYTKYLTQKGYTGSNSPTVDIQNAICLTMILEVGPGGGGASGNELANAMGTLTNVGGVDVRGLVDGWGTPLAFCRWPTGFANPNPNGVAAPIGGTQYSFGNDSVDPRGLLSAAGWVNSSALTNAAIGYTLPAAGKSYKLGPVVASAGVDKTLGLNFADFSVANATAATDNRYSTSY